MDVTMYDYDKYNIICLVYFTGARGGLRRKFS